MNQTVIRGDRGFVLVTGADAEHFLQNLITCSVENMEYDSITFGALLTPQGKVLADFFVWKEGSGFRLETSADLLDDLVKRLTMFRLRADVALEIESDLAVKLDWNEGASGPGDPRLAALGTRMLAAARDASDDLGPWHRHRIQKGIPEMEADFEAASAFPHDVLMDQFGDSGIAFSKGCYVGQEVVSRMRHRGTARNRFVKISAVDALPNRGDTLLVDDRKIGTMGSSVGQQGLALVRIDKVGTALDAGQAITTQNGLEVSLELPEFVDFRFGA